MGNRSAIAPTKLKARSAISNGSTLLSGIDGRSKDARRYRDLYHDLLSQSGGHPELCKQAAALVMQRERLDAALVRGEPVEVLVLTRLSGALNRTFAKLNITSFRKTDEYSRREHEDREAGLIP